MTFYDRFVPGGDESPGIGDGIVAGPPYDEDISLAHAGYAYHLGQSTAVRYGAFVTDAAWDPEFFPGGPYGFLAASQVISVPTHIYGELWGGRDDIGPRQKGDPVDRSQTWEVRLRGQYIDATIKGRVVGPTGVVLRSLPELILSCDGEHPQAATWMIDKIGPDDTIQGWISAVRWVSVPGHEVPEGRLESLEISPCRAGGDAPISGSGRSSWPPRPGYAYGMDIPRLGPGSRSVIGDRDPAPRKNWGTRFFVGDLWASPDPDGERWSFTRANAANRLFGTVDGTAGSIVSAYMPQTDVSVTNVPADHVVVTGCLYRWEIGSAESPLRILGGVQASIQRLTGSVRGILEGSIVTMGSPPPTGWVEIVILLYPDPVGGTVKAYFLYGDYEGEREVSWAPGQDLTVIQGGSGSIQYRAWPYLMHAPVSEVGSWSDVMGYWRSWMGWRSMMSGVGPVA